MSIQNEVKMSEIIISEELDVDDRKQSYINESLPQTAYKEESEDKLNWQRASNQPRREPRRELS